MVVYVFVGEVEIGPDHPPAGRRAEWADTISDGQSPWPL